jgi:uncharacterized protein (UPF0212 family)
MQHACGCILHVSLPGCGIVVQATRIVIRSQLALVRILLTMNGYNITKDK